MKLITFRKDKRKNLQANILVLAITMVCIAIGVKFGCSGEPGLALGEWENVHEWRKRKECLECHLSHTGLKYANRDLDGVLIPPTNYHTEQFRRYTHGRTAEYTPASCFTCHEQATCHSCHNIIPENHTAGFTEPVGDSVGMQQHILLGRIRPSACLACHKSFVSQCTGCHTADETIKWENKGQRELYRWKELYTD